MQEIETALVVLVPGSEGLVKRFRDAHDPSAAEGVPAHVTILYPFLAPDDIGPTVIDDLRRCFLGFASFGFELGRIRRFPTVLYLAPEPDQPFRALTQAVWSRYPQAPPYRGEHAEVVPHLSVAQIADESQLASVQHRFETVAVGALPISTRATEVSLMENGSGRWEVRTRFPLADCAIDIA